MWKRNSMSGNMLENHHENRKSWPNGCITSYEPVPHPCPSNHYRGYEKKIMKNTEKKRGGGYLVFLPIQPLLQFGLFTHNRFPSLCKFTYKNWLVTLRKLQKSQHREKHISKQLPSLQRTSWCTSMEYYTAATSLKVKKKNNTAAWGYLHKRLALMYLLSHTERQVVI